MSNDDDFLHDFIFQFVESPTWTTPLNNFIDKHCVIFDDAMENKLEYTDVHKEFIALVERTLEENLSILGVTNEQFLKACKEGKALRTLVFNAIMAVDDFML